LQNQSLPDIDKYMDDDDDDKIIETIESIQKRSCFKKRANGAIIVV
jgi:hypothetical protein